MAEKQPTLVFWGTSLEAALTLKQLKTAGYPIPLAITRPDQPQGRNLSLQATPVKKMALALGIKIATPTDLKALEFQSELSHQRADFFVVIAYGKILPASIFTMPKCACLNVHYSLLPKWRGASPMQAAILAGDLETGVTVMGIEKGLDSGPIFCQKALALLPDMDLPTLAQQLVPLGIRALEEVLQDFSRRNPQPQMTEKATFCAAIPKEAGLVDWSEPAEKIYRRFLAFQPKPGIYSFFRGKRVLFQQVLGYISQPGLGAPGVILGALPAEVAAHLKPEQKPLVIACGSGALLVATLKLEGKNLSTAAEFLIGYQPKPSEAFHPKPSY